MPRTFARLLVITVFLFGASLSSLSFAQDKQTSEGVFTPAQAATGKQTYDAECATCHDMEFYKDIWSYWQGRALIDFYYRIVAEMPSDNPGSLFDQEYTDIIAYILSDIGYPSGEDVLETGNGMEGISITRL
jgi:alcohol dehydrogenase (cytochrome c)|tara:strand:- start:164 stop:559 length:396 start_codon:yes stop_codon:yes gene_type:complete